LWLAEEVAEMVTVLAQAQVVCLLVMLASHRVYHILQLLVQAALVLLVLPIMQLLAEILFLMPHLLVLLQVVLLQLAAAGVWKMAVAHQVLVVPVEDQLITLLVLALA
jgi:hypothetical protein